MWYHMPVKAGGKLGLETRKVGRKCLKTCNSQIIYGRDRENLKIWKMRVRSWNPYWRCNFWRSFQFCNRQIHILLWARTRCGQAGPCKIGVFRSWRRPISSDEVATSTECLRIFSSFEWYRTWPHILLRSLTIFNFWSKIRSFFS